MKNFYLDLVFALLVFLLYFPLDLKFWFCCAVRAQWLLGFGFFFCCCFSRTQQARFCLPRKDFDFVADIPCARYFGPLARASCSPVTLWTFLQIDPFFTAFRRRFFWLYYCSRFHGCQFPAAIFISRARLSLSGSIRARRDSQARFHSCATCLSWSLVVPARQLLLLSLFS
jgi:hypothetical protein